MNNNILMIIAPEGFQDHEYGVPRDIFEEDGCNVKVASKDCDIAFGKFGMEVDIDINIKDINLENFDAIVLVGGPGAVDYLDDQDVLDLVREAFEQNKIIGAICIAPMILFAAGILKNKQVTVWDEDNNQSSILFDNDIEYTGENVTEDENIITANGPDAAEEFAELILNKLEEL
jgi:protease I